MSSSPVPNTGRASPTQIPLNKYGFDIETGEGIPTSAKAPQRPKGYMGINVESPPLPTAYIKGKHSPKKTLEASHIAINVKPPKKSCTVSRKSRRKTRKTRKTKGRKHMRK